MFNPKKLDNYLSKFNGKEFCAVFDLGSKSARILIGPKISKDELKFWNPFNWFYQDSENLELYSAVNPYSKKIDVHNSVPFIKTINFILHYKNALLQAGVKLENFLLVGTEVFRDLYNQDEVIYELFIRTSFKLVVLDKEAEAFLSLLALTHTFSFPSQNVPPMKVTNDDVIMLFDQGGGSTEISYYEVGLDKFGEQISISQVGTTALRESFFNYQIAGEIIEPDQNWTKITDQFKKIDMFVKLEIDKAFSNQISLNKFQIEGKNLIPFAMGSAILKALESKYNVYGRDLNCKSIKLNEIESVLNKNCLSIETQTQRVKNLYAQLHAEKDKILEGKLLLIYGLPVYLKLLNRFELDEIRYSYFNLKHGAFIARFFYNLVNINITHLSTKSEIHLFNNILKVETKPTNLEVLTNGNDLDKVEKIMILTALPLELKEVKKYLNSTKEVIENKDSQMYYEKYKISSKRNKAFEIFLKVTGKNNYASSGATADAINQIDPDYLFYIGIAGKLKDVEIGDVVIGDMVENYEPGKDDDEGGKVRLFQGHADDFLLSIATSIITDGEDVWQKEIKVLKDPLFKNHPKDIKGRIATGEKVLNSISSDLYQRIKNTCSESLAVETEGGGFYYQCNKKNKRGLLIRGISDKLKDKSFVEESNSQPYASSCAAAFLFELINRL